jgi:hypothetical protein
MFCYFTAYLKRSHQELFNGVLVVKKFSVLKKIKITEVYRGDYTGTGKKACAESSQARRKSQVTSRVSLSTV